MGCNCKKPGGGMKPYKPKDQSKISNIKTKKDDKK